MVIVRTMVALVASLGMIALAGCAASNSGKVYTSDQARRAQTVETGVVESVTSVTIESSDKSVAGAILGGVAGGVLGSTIGSGSGKTVASVAGALAGAAGGAAAEKKMGTKPGLEITVKQDNGQTLVVVQEADVDFRPGDRVKVLTGPDGTTRVAR